MKPYFLAAAIIFSLFGYSQKQGSSQLYAYRQKVLPGMVRVDMNGNEVPRAPQYNYYIYLVSSGKITPVEVWIDGHAYKVTAADVTTTPVEYTSPNGGENKPRVLVPKTRKKVMQLTLNVQTIKEPNFTGKKLSAHNKLVVIYKSRNKLYYKAVSQFSELPPLAMQ